jgi:hypothetical protein
MQAHPTRRQAAFGQECCEVRIELARQCGVAHGRRANRGTKAVTERSCLLGTGMSQNGSRARRHSEKVLSNTGRIRYCASQSSANRWISIANNLEARFFECTQSMMRNRALFTTSGRLRLRGSWLQPMNGSRGAVCQAAALKPHAATICSSRVTKSRSCAPGRA